MQGSAHPLGHQARASTGRSAASRSPRHPNCAPSLPDGYAAQKLRDRTHPPGLESGRRLLMSSAGGAPADTGRPKERSEMGEGQSRSGHRVPKRDRVRVDSRNTGSIASLRA